MRLSSGRSLVTSLSLRLDWNQLVLRHSGRLWEHYVDQRMVLRHNKFAFPMKAPFFKKSFIKANASMPIRLLLSHENVDAMIAFQYKGQYNILQAEGSVELVEQVKVDPCRCTEVHSGQNVSRNALNFNASRRGRMMGFAMLRPSYNRNGSNLAPMPPLLLAAITVQSAAPAAAATRSGARPVCGSS